MLLSDPSNPNAWESSFDLADDFALLITAQNVEIDQVKLNRAIRWVLFWMTDYGLSLAQHKTKIVVIIKKKKA